MWIDTEVDCPVCNTTQVVEVEGDGEIQCYCDECETTFTVVAEIEVHIYGEPKIIIEGKIKEDE